MGAPATQIMKDLVLRIVEKIGVAVKLVPAERMRAPIVERISVVPQTTEKVGRVIQPVPPERIQGRIVEPIPVLLQTSEKIAYCVGDQIVEAPVPLITEKIVDDVFFDNSGACRIATGTLGKFLLCVIILMTRLARLTMWVSSRVWTSATCLDLEMLWCLCPRSTRAPWQ